MDLEQLLNHTKNCTTDSQSGTQMLAGILHCYSGLQTFFGNRANYPVSEHHRFLLQQIRKELARLEAVIQSQRSDLKDEILSIRRGREVHDYYQNQV